MISFNPTYLSSITSKLVICMGINMKNKKINLLVRVKNPLFWVQVGGAVLVTALAYHSMQPQDLTTWRGLLDLGKGVLGNPYLIGLCVWNAWSAANDPTTEGIADSRQALNYKKPKRDTQNGKGA